MGKQRRSLPGATYSKSPYQGDPWNHLILSFSPLDHAVECIASFGLGPCVTSQTRFRPFSNSVKGPFSKMSLTYSTQKGTQERHLYLAGHLWLHLNVSTSWRVGTDSSSNCVDLIASVPLQNAMSGHFIAKDASHHCIQRGRLNSLKEDNKDDVGIRLSVI